MNEFNSCHPHRTEKVNKKIEILKGTVRIAATRAIATFAPLLLYVGRLNLTLHWRPRKGPFPRRRLHGRRCFAGGRLCGPCVRGIPPSPSPCVRTREKTFKVSYCDLLLSWSQSCWSRGPAPFFQLPYGRSLATISYICSSVAKSASDVNLCASEKRNLIPLAFHKERKLGGDTGHNLARSSGLPWQQILVDEPPAAVSQDIPLSKEAYA